MGSDWICENASAYQLAYDVMRYDAKLQYAVTAANIFD